jgi:hypothetical protein
MLFVPTGKLSKASTSGVEAMGSITAFGLP